ncbi:MAG: hypothetical protein LQ341_001502 [Variospora aurantia]|nr:MAG: hypothetical protein LQ341_001502 [Variospora aurantia]
MLISSITTLILISFLALPGASILRFHRMPFRDEFPSLCYDSRYASSPPNLDQCIAIIAHQILTPQYEGRDTIFTRRPTSPHAYRVPHTWTTRAGGCRVVIDVPESPHKPILGETASMLDVKLAALELMTKCVIKGDQLGGIAVVGRNMQLHVMVEGREQGGAATD